MEYKNFNLKVNDAQKIVTINNNDIKVFTYLPILQKNDLIQIAIQQATEMGMINEIKLEMYFNLFIIYMYTDLIFTDEEKADPAQLYDELQSEQVFDKVITAIGDDYNVLVDFLEAMRKTKEKTERSAAGVLKMLTQSLPENATAAAQILEKFNLNETPEVVKFAQAANGGRLVPQLVEPIKQD